MGTNWVVRTGRGLGILGFTLFFVSGAQCISNDPPRGPRIAGLEKFDSATELRTYLADQVHARMNPPDRVNDGGFLFNMGGMPLGAPESGADAVTADDSAGGAGESVEFSTTNIQEAGVDESDIVKNDADTIFMLEGKTVHVVSAYPVDTIEEIATVELDEYGDSLYLYGDKLIVLTQRHQYWWGDVTPLPGFADPGFAVDEVAVSEPSGGGDAQEPTAQAMADVVGGPWHDGAQAGVVVVDVNDPANPVIERKVEFEGGLVNSRMIDGRLYLILSTTPRLPSDPTPEAIDAMSLDEWIPDYRDTDGEGNVVGGDIVDWPNVYRPIQPDGYAMTLVVTMDIADPEAAFESTMVSADVGTIYSSTEALYLTDVQYDYQFGESREDTMIHKLVFDEAGTVYVASGLVPGRPLNQYSLGEYEDHLRIATTVQSFGPFESVVSNSIYVLGVNEETLEITGKVEQIAPGETIYAARFMGPRGFLVTFERIDPLFTLDLSDPANPTVVGELKVPGYSDHIQMLDENHLLTIGKDAQDNGSFAWVQGVQLSIFDITDMANPTLKFKEIIGGRGTNSEANYNPKAFNHFAPLNALAFPIDLFSGDTTGPEWGMHEFTGLYVYEVTTEAGFTFLGRIASAEGEVQQGCFEGYYGSTRGVFIDQAVYSVTERSVKAASIDDVATLIGNATFANAESLQTNCYFNDFDIALPGGGGLR